MFTPFATQNQFDPDAGAFINVTGIGGIEAVAINNLVEQLKAAGLWSSFLAIYPMVGGTAYTHKFNLVNPQDTNGAYRLNFQGTWTHNASGALPNGASGTYADTYINQSVSPLTQTNGHISYYSFTNNAGAEDVEIGAGFSGGADVGESLLATRWTDNNFYSFWYHKQSASGGGGSANTTSAGYYITNKATNTEGWKNGTRVINTGTGAATTGNYTFYLGAQNNGTTSYRNSTRGCCFASIGRSLPTGGPANLTNIVNTFNRTLQRNVF